MGYGATSYPQLEDLPTWQVHNKPTLPLYHVFTCNMSGLSHYNYWERDQQIQRVDIIIIITEQSALLVCLDIQLQ